MSPIDPAKLSAMDEAALVALDEFDELWSRLGDTEKVGAREVLDWLKEHYRKAGYKRLLSRGIFKKEL